MHDGSSDPTEECHICGEIPSYDFFTFCEECGKNLLHRGLWIKLSV